MPDVKVDVRRHGPLRARSGATTAMDTYERLGRPGGRSREFWDAIMRVSAPAVPGVPTEMKEQGRWDS